MPEAAISSRSALPRAIVLLVAYVVVALTPLAVAVVSRPAGGHAALAEAGRAAALVGITLLALQFVVSARLRWVERPFGLDQTLGFHRMMGVFALALLLVHPLLLAAGNGSWRLVTAWDVGWHIWLGRAALALLLIHVAVSIFSRTIRLSFEAWRVLHDALALTVLALTFVHSWFAGGDLDGLAMRVIWLVLPTLAAAMYVWHRVVRPRRLAANDYRVTEVKPEAPGVWTLRLEPPEGTERFDYLPGQYQFLTLRRPRQARELPAEEHHWTISSSPTQPGFVTSTIKESGDFTSTIGMTRPGDTATVHAPFGRFSHVLHPEEGDLVFVAAGIGITPLMSMLRHLRDSGDGRPVLLIYGNRAFEDIVFRDELAEMEAVGLPGLRVVHVLSDPGDGWTGDRGRIDTDLIERHCDGRLDGRSFWVCGPTKLREAVVAGLQQKGVAVSRIYAEAFEFVDGAPRARVAAHGCD